MSLVDSDRDLPNLNLRVFKRSSKILVLLWNRLADVDGKLPTITAKSFDTHQQLNVTEFILDPQKRTDFGDNLEMDPNTIVCVIQEDKNALDEKQNYYLTVEYEGTEIRQGLRITKAGVLPDHEREDRARNTHNFLWDGKSQMWRKWHGVMVEGKFYAGVVPIPCTACGWDPSKGDR